MIRVTITILIDIIILLCIPFLLFFRWYKYIYIIIGSITLCAGLMINILLCFGSSKNPTIIAYIFTMILSMLFALVFDNKELTHVIGWLFTNICLGHTFLATYFVLTRNISTKRDIRSHELI